jgi:hypothetical protein
MEFSNHETFEIKLTKSLIVDLVEKCLLPTVFQDDTIEPTISCESKEQRFDLNNLNLIEFKEEIFNDTKIDYFSMCMSNYDKKMRDYVLFMKNTTLEDEIEVVFRSNSKMWIDDNLLVIKEFLCNYKENKKTIKQNKVETRCENKNIISEVTEKQIKNSIDKPVEISNENEILKQGKKETLTVIGIVVTALGVIATIIIGVVEIMK